MPDFVFIFGIFCLISWLVFRLGFIGKIVLVEFSDGSLIASFILVRLLRSKFF